MLYSNGDINDLCEKVKSLLDSPSKRADMGVRAYYTICNEWSPEIAASRLVDLVNSGFKLTYDDGPCSKVK
jgi:spore maturation protein CgeB